MPSTTVSCVMPVFNGQNYLEEALESALSQTYESLEIVVVDDGSTDATPEILRAYRDRIQNLRQENSGPSAARNLGIEHSTGEFLCFLDADDIWIAEKTASQVALLEGDPELGVCTGYQKNFWVDSLREEEQRSGDSDLAKEQPGPSSTLMARRTVFETIGSFDPNLRHRDTAAWILNARRAGVKILETEDLWVHRRLHENNLSRSRGTEDADELFSLIRARRSPSLGN